ncbi:6536_t:CDS:2, partial [Scutellospora calospora]
CFYPNSDLMPNYEWISAVGIDPNSCPERLKHFLVGFHEILEGNGEKINKDAVNRVFEIDPSSQEYADSFANSFIGVQIHLQNERKTEKLLEGKSWRELENENKFEGYLTTNGAMINNEPYDEIPVNSVQATPEQVGEVNHQQQQLAQNN